MKAGETLDDFNERMMRLQNTERGKTPTGDVN